jgi:hypothetical protein
MPEWFPWARKSEDGDEYGSLSPRRHQITAYSLLAGWQRYSIDIPAAAGLEAGQKKEKETATKRERRWEE